MPVGRPSLPPELARSAQLVIRLTPAEKEAIFQAAATAGVTVTAYLVGLAIGDRFGGLIKGEGFTPSSSQKLKKEEG